MKKKSKLPVSRHLLSDMVIIIGWNYEREMLSLLIFCKHYFLYEIIAFVHTK